MNTPDLTQKHLTNAQWYKMCVDSLMPHKPSYIAAYVSFTWYGGIDGSTVIKYFLGVQWGPVCKIFESTDSEKCIEHLNEYLNSPER